MLQTATGGLEVQGSAGGPESGLQCG